MEYDVAILFARQDSNYKLMPGCDVYDIERDALTYPGGLPVVAHPPCRAWGRLAHMAKPRPNEKELAIWAISQVREWGGVLEHPKGSKLWNELALPLGKQRDEFGGYTVSVDQFWWGHKARKATWLYVCGIEPAELPFIPIRLGRATHTIASSKKKHHSEYYRPEVTKAEREHTPPALAQWLVSVARMTNISITK